MQVLTLPGQDRRSRSWPSWVLGVAALLLTIGTIASRSNNDAVVKAVGAPGQTVTLEGIPATFPSDVHREELLAVARLQADGMLVPTWLPTAGMTVGRSTTDGDGSYDLWYATADDRYVHLIVRDPPLVPGSALVEVHGFTREDVERVRESLRILAPDSR